MVRGVSKLKAAGKTTFFCLSNANEVFIKTILKVRMLSSIRPQSDPVTTVKRA